MKERWFVFSGVAIFDHEGQRFWHRDKIKDLATDMFNDIDFGRKPRNNKELRDILVEEFPQFTDKTYTHKYWDDEGNYELIEVPYNVGFGIIMGDTKRFRELLKIYSKRADKLQKQ